MSRLPMVSLLCILAACGDAGTAPDNDGPAATAPAFAAKPNPSFQPFAFTVSNCLENVDVSGTFHPVLRGIPGVDRHILFHINAKGTGVGQTTGARYQWNDRLFDNDHVLATGQTSFILNDNTRLIGQGGAPNAVFHLRIKVTVNARGVVTVNRFVVRDDCR
ncbi:MAG: hypothetical protein EHM24_23690 [Acidobacteria bacterium]|nr:MAG: hypothetical protein EHM24_23690 [Acidobacteriota bacterium]